MSGRVKIVQPLSGYLQRSSFERRVLRYVVRRCINHCFQPDRQETTNGYGFEHAQLRLDSETIPSSVSDPKALCKAILASALLHFTYHE